MRCGSGRNLPARDGGEEFYPPPNMTDDNESDSESGSEGNAQE